MSKYLDKYIFILNEIREMEKIEKEIKKSIYNDNSDVISRRKKLAYSLVLEKQNVKLKLSKRKTENLYKRSKRVRDRLFIEMEDSDKEFDFSKHIEKDAETLIELFSTYHTKTAKLQELHNIAEKSQISHNSVFRYIRNKNYTLKIDEEIVRMYMNTFKYIYTTFNVKYIGILESLNGMSPKYPSGQVKYLSKKNLRLSKLLFCSILDSVKYKLEIEDIEDDSKFSNFRHKLKYLKKHHPQKANEVIQNLEDFKINTDFITYDIKDVLSLLEYLEPKYTKIFEKTIPKILYIKNIIDEVEKDSLSSDDIERLNIVDDDFLAVLAKINTEIGYIIKLALIELNGELISFYNSNKSSFLTEEELLKMKYNNLKTELKNILMTIKAPYKAS